MIWYRNHIILVWNQNSNMVRNFKPCMELISQSNKDRYAPNYLTEALYTGQA